MEKLCNIQVLLDKILSKLVFSVLASSTAWFIFLIDRCSSLLSIVGMDSITNIKLQFCFLYIPRLGCHQKVTASPVQGVVTGENIKTKNPFTLTFTYHNCSDTPWYSKRGATRQVVSLSLIMGSRTPNKTPLLPAGSHRRFPIPLCTTSKVCPCQHFINHAILSNTLLHASRSRHSPLPGCQIHIYIEKTIIISDRKYLFVIYL